MKVGEIMASPVEFIDGDATVAEAAVMMGELDVGAMPVGDADALDGVVTDRDILYRVVAKGHAGGEIRVRDVASRPVIGCGEGDTVQDAMDVMAAHQIRRLAVRDEGGRVVGWITLSDLAKHLLVESEPLQAALEELGKGSK